MCGYVCVTVSESYEYIWSIRVRVGACFLFFFFIFGCTSNICLSVSSYQRDLFMCVQLKEYITVEIGLNLIQFESLQNFVHRKMEKKEETLTTFNYTFATNILFYDPMAIA